MSDKPIDCKDWTGRKLPTVTCSVCSYVFDAATEVTQAKAKRRPMPGDLTFCMKCGELYMFDNEMNAVVPTLEHLCKLSASQMRELSFIQQEIRHQRPLG